jgi:hypothetical protein
VLGPAASSQTLQRRGHASGPANESPFSSADIANADEPKRGTLALATLAEEPRVTSRRFTAKRWRTLYDNCQKEQPIKLPSQRGRSIHLVKRRWPARPS